MKRFACVALATTFAFLLCACATVPSESQPATVPDNAAPESQSSEIPGVTLSPGNLPYLDVTEGMYSDPRNGENPLTDDCISAGEATDLANTAAQAMGINTEGLIWKLNAAEGDIYAPGQAMWSCVLSLPSPVTDPTRLPEALRDLSATDIERMAEQDSPVRIFLNALTGQVLSANAPDVAWETVFLSEDATQRTAAYREELIAWYASEEATERTRQAAEALCGMPLTSFGLEDDSFWYKWADEAGRTGSARAANPELGLIASFVVEKS